MSYEIVNEFPHKLFNSAEQPCISLYQPTHRHGPENQQDPIRFKNLTTEIKDSLKKEHDQTQIERLMKPLEQLALDRDFWQHTTEGLALFANENACIVYRLRRPVKELANVATSFHIKPLIRVFQSSDGYHLLGLTRESFTLYEGNRYGVEEITLDPSIERTIEEALGDEYTEKQVTAGAYSGLDGRAMFHGHGSKKEVINVDTERYFRHVDRVVFEHYSQPMKLPLYLVALGEYHTPFQKISHNPFLQKNGIHFDADAVSLEDLREKAWEMIEPLYLEKTKQLVDNFHQAQAQFNGSSDIAQVVRAAVEGRVSQILIESDRLYPGRVNIETGELISGDLADPKTDDVLDDIAEIVFNNKGEVVVLPEERMPSDTGVAATFRY